MKKVWTVEMSICKRCGESYKFTFKTLGRSICNDCYLKEIAHSKAKEEERVKEQNEKVLRQKEENDKLKRNAIQSELKRNRASELYDKGINFVLNGEFEMGQKAFEASLAKDNLYEASGTSIEVLTDMRKQGVPDEMIINFFKGADFTNCEKFDEAIDTFNTVINAGIIHEYLYASRGVAYSRKGNHQQAISDYNSSLEVNSRCAHIIGLRGFSYYLLGHIDYALRDYNEALKLNPNDINSYTNRGFLHMEAGRTKEACSDFKKACELGQCDNYMLGREKGICD